MKRRTAAARPYCAQEVFCKRAQEMSVKKEYRDTRVFIPETHVEMGKDMQKEQNVRLVLASASPAARRELLSADRTGIYRHAEQKRRKCKSDRGRCAGARLSRQKAVDIWEQLSGGQEQNPDADQEQISEETQEPNLNGKTAAGAAGDRRGHGGML